MSPNNNEVHIYAKKGTKWEVENILKEVSVCVWYVMPLPNLSFTRCAILVNVISPARPASHWYGLGSK